MMKLTPEEQQRIKEVAAYAKENPFERSDEIKVLTGLRKSAATDENHIVKIGKGIQVVYTLEKQPTGDWRHLSLTGIGVAIPRTMLDAVMKEFGFERKSNDEGLMLWTERGVINIIEQICNCS